MRGLDNRGSMPFAVIAVTLLLASTAMAATVYGHWMAERDSESVSDDIDSADEAVDDIAVYVNRGLGEIIRSISTATDGETGESDALDERAETFREKAAGWIEFQFPIRSGGTVAHLISHDLDLVAEAVGLASADGTGGYTPAYLRGTGTIEVRLESQSGSGSTTITVSTDGSYALPLSAERGSLFESMAGGDGVSVSEMVIHQLTSLAQYRVMNGYGSTSEYGERGTGSIITPEDVEAAYGNALEVVSMICFRDRDNRFAHEGSVDLADILVAEDGVMELDLSAVYAQALMAVIDDVALRWFDYFCGFQVLNELDKILNPLRNAVSSLIAFVVGEEAVYSAVPYVRDTMSLAGIPESEYRRPGSGTTALTFGGVEVVVENPTYDVLSAPWLKDFGKRYEQGSNFIMDYILDVLRGAAVRISESTWLGTVSVDVDPYDDMPFAEELAELFSEAVSDGVSAVEDAVGGSLGSSTVYDPYYGAIADEISAHADEMVLESELRDRILSAFEAALPEDSDTTVEDLASSDELRSALRAYEVSVRSDLEVFDQLRRVEDGDSVIKEVLTRICAFGLDLIGITDPVPEMAGRMCDEIVEISRLNPHGGVTELPGSPGFLMDDGSGNLTEETLDVELSSSLVVDTIRVDESRSVHTVGFRENLSAAYSTVFVVGIDDLIDLRVVGNGALSETIGDGSSVLRDTVVFGGGDGPVMLEVTVASGWPLAGVEYAPSVTVLDDLKAALLSLLEPLIEPLRKVMETVRTVFTTVSEAMVEALTFVSEQLERIYEAVIGPLAELREWLESAVESVFSEAALGFLVSIGMDEQHVVIEFFGCTLELSTKAVTWAANTKTLLEATLTMPVADLVVTAGVTAKVRGDVSAENLIVTGFGGVEKGDEWGIEVNLDPLMKGSKYLITVDGTIGDVGFSMVAPKLESYHEMGVALSDVPGLGDVVGNIPVMGAKVGLDAGFSLKYSDPVDTGLIINEFESNPAGEDRGHEWVELLNNSATTIDLSGYTLLAASDRRTKCMELSGTISPGEFLVIYPEFTLVNSSGKYTKNGEAVVLKDPDGNEVDRTPTKKDTANDGMTWQRSFDGSREWVFADGSQGRTNADYPGSQWVSATEMKDTVWKAVERSFDRVGTITDLETLQEFLQHLVRYTLEGLIGVVSDRIVEASVFVSVDVSDPTSSASAGLRVALRTDGDMVEDVLRYIVGKVMELVLKAENPYRIDPVGMFAENIDLEVTFRTGIGFPEILSDGADLPSLDLGATFRTNLSAITRLLGTDTGRPEVVFGIRVIDCPDAAIPSKLSPKEGMEHDLWLVRITAVFGRRPPYLNKEGRDGERHGGNGLQDPHCADIGGADGEGLPQGR